MNLWHDSSQRKRDLPEKREESEAARDGEETHFGQPETGIGDETHTSGDRRHAATEEAHKICETDERRIAGLLADRREKGTRRLTWCRDQVFEDSDGGRANSRERIRPNAFNGSGGGHIVPTRPQSRVRMGHPQIVGPLLLDGKLQAIG